MTRPVIFLSAVSQELATARRAVAATVRTLGYDPVSQEQFPTGHGELRAWLREQIDGCEGLIQLVGHGYGAEPAEVDPAFGRVSYTQYEFLYARQRGKKTWIIVVGDGCQCDKTPDQLDLPADPHAADPAAYQAERRQLQQKYVERLHQQNHLRHTVESRTELENVVLRLRDELGQLRKRSERQLRRLAGAIAALMLGLLLLGGGVWWGYQRLHTDIEQASVVNVEKIRARLLQNADETHRRELAEAEQAADWKERQRLREAAEASRVARLARIDELADSFAEIEGRGAATSVFKEMTRILSEPEQGGVDEAIAYVAGQRPNILKTVRARAAAARERNRADLEPLLKAAALHQNKGQAAEARELYADILAAEPDWPAALAAGFWFHVDQGDSAQIRGRLSDAARDYEQGHQFAEHLAALQPDQLEWQRDLAVSYDRLGEVAKMNGSLDKAKRAYTTGREIRLKLCAADAANLGWQRDLAVSHQRLGDVAKAEGHLDVALEEYTHELEIAQKIADHDPDDLLSLRELSVAVNKLGDVAVAQGNLPIASQAYDKGLKLARLVVAGDPKNAEWANDLWVSYMKFGEVADHQGKPDEAQQCFAAGLEVIKQLAADDPKNLRWQRNASVAYHKIGDFAQAQRKFDVAEQAFRDALERLRQVAAVDPANTAWQRDLSVSYERLGSLAVERDKLAEAADWYTQDLAISKKLAATDPSNVLWQRDLSVSCNNLGDVQGMQHDYEQAARNYAQGLEIILKVVAADPNNGYWRHDLSSSYNKVGDAAQAQGKLDEAAAAFHECLEIRRQEAAADPSNTRWQSGLALILWKLSDLAKLAHNPDESKGLLQEAADALEGVERRGSTLKTADRTMLEKIRAELAELKQ